MVMFLLSLKLFTRAWVRLYLRLYLNLLNLFSKYKLVCRDRRGGGGGGYLKTFCTGKLCPTLNPLPFLGDGLFIRGGHLIQPLRFWRHLFLKSLLDTKAMDNFVDSLSTPNPLLACIHLSKST